MKVEITSATECRSLNGHEVRYGKKLIYKEYFAEMSPIIGKKATLEMYHRHNNNWQQAESERKTYKIDIQRMIADFNSFVGFGDGELEIGSIHEAKQIEGTNEVIIL